MMTGVNGTGKRTMQRDRPTGPKPGEVSPTPLLKTPAAPFGRFPQSNLACGAGHPWGRTHPTPTSLPDGIAAYPPGTGGSSESVLTAPAIPVFTRKSAQKTRGEMSLEDGDSVTSEVQMLAETRQATNEMLVLMLGAKTSDEVEQAFASLINPLPEGERVLALASLLGALSTAVVTLRASVTGVATVLDSTQAVYVSHMVSSVLFGDTSQTK